MAVIAATPLLNGWDDTEELWDVMMRGDGGS
jgi:hypothetical protein